jgi:hypothetical protein
MSHNLSSKFRKKFTLEGLGHVVRQHKFRGAIKDFKVSLFNLIRQKEIADVEGTSALGRTLLTILEQKDSAFVVLEKDVLFNRVALSRHKIHRPENKRRGVVRANEFTFSGAASIEGLFLDQADGATMTEGKVGAGVAFEIGMDSKRHIGVPFEDSEIISGEDEFVGLCRVEKLHKSQEFAPVVVGWSRAASAEGGDRSLNIGAGTFAKVKTFSNESVEDCCLFRG